MAGQLKSPASLLKEANFDFQTATINVPRTCDQVYVPAMTHKDVYELSGASSVCADSKCILSM